MSAKRATTTKTTGGPQSVPTPEPAWQRHMITIHHDGAVYRLPHNVRRLDGCIEALYQTLQRFADIDDIEEQASMVNWEGLAALALDMCNQMEELREVAGLIEKATEHTPDRACLNRPGMPDAADVVQ